MANDLKTSNISIEQMCSEKMTTYTRSDYIKIVNGEIAKLLKSKETSKHLSANAAMKIERSLNDCNNILHFLEGIEGIDSEKTKNFIEILNNTKSQLKVTKNGNRLCNAIEKLISTLKGNCLVNTWYVDRLNEVINDFYRELDDFLMDTGAPSITMDMFIKNKIKSIKPDIEIYKSEVMHIYSLFGNPLNIGKTNEIVSAFMQPPGTESAKLLLQLKEYIRENLNDPDITANKSPYEIMKIRSDIENFRERVVELHKEKDLDKDTDDVRHILEEMNNNLRAMSLDFLNEQFPLTQQGGEQSATTNTARQSIQPIQSVQPIQPQLQPTV